MTPICTCKDPTPVVTKHPATQYRDPCLTTHCERCGYHYSVKHGSRIVPGFEPTPPTDQGAPAND